MIEAVQRGKAVQRRKNALLAGLCALRGAAPTIGMSEILAFFYIAENPGVRTKELAELMRTTEATASRSARRMLVSGAPGALEPSTGWLVMSRNERENISRHYFLTPAGAQLADRLDEIIARAKLIGGQAGDPRKAGDQNRSLTTAVQTVVEARDAM